MAIVRGSVVSLVAAFFVMGAAMMSTSSLQASADESHRQTVFWLFAHPDDETLAAGGALAQSQRAGNHNVVVFLTNGESTAVGPAEHLTPAEVGQSRKLEASAALRAIGIEDVHFIGLGEGSFDEAYVRTLIDVLLDMTPGEVHFAGHSPFDEYLGMQCGHPDHCAIARALWSAWRDGLIEEPGFFRIGHLMGGPVGGRCGRLPPDIQQEKLRMIASYTVVDRRAGRLAIGLQSVPDALRMAKFAPECVDSCSFEMDNAWPCLPTSRP